MSISVATALQQPVVAVEDVESEQEFADMYGMKQGEVARTLQRARAARQASSTAA